MAPCRRRDCTAVSQDGIGNFVQVSRTSVVKTARMRTERPSVARCHDPEEMFNSRLDTHLPSRLPLLIVLVSVPRDAAAPISTSLVRHRHGLCARFRPSWRRVHRAVVWLAVNRRACGCVSPLYSCPSSLRLLSVLVLCSCDGDCSCLDVSRSTLPQTTFVCPSVVDAPPCTPTVL